MAATSEGAIDWAASRGFSILMDPHSSTTELGAKRRRYRDKLAEAGFSDAGRDIPMARLLALASTTGRGRGHRAPRRAMAGRFLRRAAACPSQDQHVQRTYDGKEPAQHYVDSVILHGTPASVVDQIARLKEEIGLNYLMCAPLSRETFRLLADEVLPRL